MTSASSLVRCDGVIPRSNAPATRLAAATLSSASWRSRRRSSVSTLRWPPAEPPPISRRSVPNSDLRVLEEPQRGGLAVVGSGGKGMFGREAVVDAHHGHVGLGGQVEQADFVVLRAPDAPSAAVEEEHHPVDDRWYEDPRPEWGRPARAAPDRSHCRRSSPPRCRHRRAVRRALRRSRTTAPPRVPMRMAPFSWRSSSRSASEAGSMAISMAAIVARCAGSGGGDVDRDAVQHRVPGERVEDAPVGEHVRVHSGVGGGDAHRRAGPVMTPTVGKADDARPDRVGDFDRCDHGADAATPRWPTHRR